MKNQILMAGAFAAACLFAPGAAAGSFPYPQAPQNDQADDYHGVKVPDRFRPLEDLDSAQTKAWVEAENKVTFDFLGKIAARDTIRKRLTQIWNYERYSAPHRRGQRYFFTKNDGLQNQSVLYYAAALEASPALLLDPNKLSADGTVALSGTAITEEGELMAYGLSSAGSDWQTWKVREVATGRDLADEIKWVKFSGASWTKDSKGFFYSRYDEPKGTNEFKGINRFQKLYYHRLGTPQAEDKLIYHRPDQPDWGLQGGVTDDGRYLIISVTRGTDTKNGLFYLDLQKTDAQVVELLNTFDADYTFIDNDGPLFWFRTDNHAPRGKVIVININQPSPADWKELIPEGKDTLIHANAVNHQFIVSYLQDAHTAVRFYELSGKYLRDLDLPGLGTAGGFEGKRHDTDTFYSYTSFNAPPVIYRLDLPTGRSTVFRQPKVGFDPADIAVSQVFYQSKDGTRVPMFICHKKGIKLDGSNPTYLYGYGGFNISLTPAFSPANMVWMEMGGVYAMPNLRGGGEYGEQWHQGGMKLKKQNVFDDFISAAEWLIDNKYTRSDKLAIGGGSNGGLLVGACMTQRPELFGAALPAVGVMDMLRFHKFTIGWAWTSDYGSPDVAEEFKAIFAYSPLHHLKKGAKYPATLITTADHDDRVVPAHSFKFAAALQEAHGGEAPVLIRIETRAGHGAGKPTAKVIEEAADKWAFLTEVLKMEVKP